jgi:hypothetical protein
LEDMQAEREQPAPCPLAKTQELPHKPSKGKGTQKHEKLRGWKEPDKGHHLVKRQALGRPPSAPMKETHVCPRTEGCPWDITAIL